MPRNYIDEANDTKNTCCASGWIQRAIVELEKRDCVDAYYDALHLAELAKMRMDEALNKGNG